MTEAKDLSTLRCFNHSQREAAARCPGCKRHFCRECVTEHDGKVYCSQCLRQRTAGEAGRKRRPWLLPCAAAAMGTAAAWFIFYCLGWLLTRIPTSFHEGSLWSQ